MTAFRNGPTVPKIELNARAARKGWESWGLEAPMKEAYRAGDNVA
jgi:N6-adenosine-specific RNA methylase IME4